MNSTSSKSPTPALVVAAKENLAKVVSHHSFNTALKSQVNGTFNATYSRIWKLIQTPTNLEDIYKTVLKETHVDCQLCEQDILSLIQTLARLGLIDIRIEIKGA